MNILFATSEVRPWSSTGGLSDVLDALPRALAATGDHRVTVVSPLYRSARQAAERMNAPLVDTGVHFEWPLRSVRHRGRFLRTAVGDGPAQIFLDCPALYDRDGLYVDAQHREWPDNAERFGFFSRAVATCAHELAGGKLDVLHANDWQTGLVALWADLAPEGRPAVVFGLHNLGYQGIYPAHLIDTLELPWSRFHLHELEYFGQLNLLKAGIVFSDLVVTVSPTYAEEITTPTFGHTLDGLMRAHRHKLHGVLNGIDESTWNPATDPALPAHYRADDLRGKLGCHAALCEEMGIDPGRRPLFGVISRFAWQKGVDVIADIAERIVSAGGAIAALGSGDEFLELRFSELARLHPGAIGARIGYDVGLSHRIEAGADAFLMPSRYEPCGLNQMYSMAYGTVPIVTSTGGLRDTVIDATPNALAAGEATGFTCAASEPEALWHAVERAIDMFRSRPEQWQQLVQAGMAHDFSWRRPAHRYEELYRLAIARARMRSAAQAG